MSLALAALLLGGCMLVSGEQGSSDVQPDSGNVSSSFVSAEGSQERSLATGRGGTFNVITIVAVQQGDLRVEVLDPSGSVVLAVQGRPNEQVTRTGSVPSDAQGNLRYRVSARGARDGSYQLLFQRQ